MSIQQQYHRPLLFSSSAESGMVISRFRPRFQRDRPETEKAIDPINRACPVKREAYLTGVNPACSVGPRGIAGTGRQIVLGSNINIVMQPNPQSKKRNLILNNPISNNSSSDYIQYTQIS